MNKVKTKALQKFDSNRIVADSGMSKLEIARFVSDFQKIVSGDEGKRKLISMRVPERLLTQFKAKAGLREVPYQTQILRLMREWILNG